ncbi:MAG: hypothetical protein M5U07_15230 [Xanthobacteraceae bacterium]|nr:hypothetical protein [Xanthobacteraceae bacterium]GIK80611.1 MAG: hypothetical protein BroJett024_17160 [Alphaproteobacteria bacterium]
MRKSLNVDKCLLLTLLAVAGLAYPSAPVGAQGYKAAGGLAVYLGVMPTGIIKGPSPHATERLMHGGSRNGPHEYHVVAAVFDAASGARVSDATVTAQVSGVGLAGPRKTLEPMQIAGTTTYGEYFSLPGRDTYTVKLTIERPGATRSVVVDFKYEHQR